MKNHKNKKTSVVKISKQIKSSNSKGGYGSHYESKYANHHLDGSKDHYKYREYGRFGSHCSYDDYSEESFA